MDVLADASEQLEVDRPAVVGHSFGVPIALCWAAAHSVSALVLASPVGMTPLRIGRARAVLPVHKLLARSERLWEAAAVRSRVPRRVIFGWFVGMNDLDGLEPAQARSLLRGAARAAPVVPFALPALEHLDLRAARRRGRRAVPRRVGRARPVGLGQRAAATPTCWAPRRWCSPGVGHMPMIEAPYSFGVAVADFV